MTTAKEQLRAAATSQVDALADASGLELPLLSRTIASALVALDDGFALQELFDPSIRPDSLWDVVDYLTPTLTGTDPQTPSTGPHRSDDG